MEEKSFWYREYKQGRRFIIKIRPEESITKCITELVTKEKINCAVILSAIGSVKNVRIKDIKSGARLPISSPRLVEHDIEGPLELLGLSGNVIPDEDGKVDCHLHIMASKSSGDVIGGHLYDAIVFATCEIVLVELNVEGIERYRSKSGGTPTLFFSEE